MHTITQAISRITAIKARCADGFSRFTSRPPPRWLCQRWIPWLLVPVIAAVSFVAISQSTAPTPPNIPPVVLSADPLYATTTGDKPALALTLSVEYPTVGAQYVDVPQATTDGSYTNTKEYLGYYDAESCYTYNNAPTETPVAPQTTADFKRFDRSGPATALTMPDAMQPTRTSRMCTNAFSGNFLNWASSSAIDMLRLALTGGDRYIDTPSLTILQRAVLPDGDPINFWNSQNFPGKQLLKSGGSSGAAYFGAVPTAMATAAGANDIWVVNRLNQIYFGIAKVGNDAGSATSYTLGGVAASSSTGPVVNPYQTQSTGQSTFGGSYCSDENGNCSFTGVKEVLYGAPSSGGQAGGWITFLASNGVTCGNNVTGSFVDPAPSIGKKCYTRAYNGPWAPITTGSLNSDGFFYSRVQVCNVDNSGLLQDSRDYGLCQKYPNGNYKPSGVIQKYSDQLRLAAFGYLMDQTASYNNGRYGGVLRAPMKYVGARTFDVNGIDSTPTTGNPVKEWDETTGVFIVNPADDATYGKSGVTTYLNQFGRTGPVKGRYKIYDPVGELHYEALRYLQGLQPSPDAVSNIQPAMYDGFPVTTTWADPYGDGRSNSSDYSCLKSNIVMIGDINTHDGNRLPAANTANNIPDINYWRSIVQSFEKNSATSYIDGQGTSRTTGNPNGANGSVPGNTQTSQIMGSAYWSHTHDIRGTNWTGTSGPAKQRPGLRVKTFTFDVNEYAAQNNVNTRRYANQLFTAAKYGGFETDPSNLGKAPYNTFGNPFKKQDGTNDNNVWQDPANPGEASTYYLQSNARGVLSAFDSIFNRASTAARSIAGGAIQSKNLTQAGDTIYQGTFDTSDWSGDLLAIPVSVSEGNVVTISNSTTWTASAQLAALASPATARNIVVGNAGATAYPVATSFSWGSIESSLQAALNKPAPTSASDGLGQDRLNYLRGDHSKESTVFRKRNKLLGDIINSGVVYSGAPATNIISSTYTGFYTTNASRTPAVFVGANDGMFHAFHAKTGDELFAYIPSWMGSKLSALTSPAYVNNHQSYVDGPPAVAEAQVGSAGNAADWKTVLVSGTGGGGQGVFALDVTNPAAFTASSVMWEFTHADDPEMGNVMGRPQILKLRTSAAGVKPATYKWFAVVGSGVNNYVADSAGVFSTTGSPALFLLDLGKPAGTAWVLGTNYYKISLPVDGTLSATKATGLINFRAALGSAREVTQIFMGDLHGNLWKLDFSMLGITDWTINKLSPFSRGSVPVPSPLFVARDASGNVQPITMAPSIAYGPVQDSGVIASYVTFGTGKYLEVSDRNSTAQQTVYMVYDNGDGTNDTKPAGLSAINGRGRLQAGTANASTGAITVPAFTLGRAAKDTDTTQRSGWYADFPTSGERQISSSTVVGNSIVFGSLIPAASAGSCSAAGGGNQYTVNIASGGGTAISSSVGIMGEPLVAEVSGATAYSISDSTGRRTKTVTSQVIQQGSIGLSLGGTATTKVIAGRLSWRQINNYQDLKNAP
ncbi:MAG: pilus assembly protein PilY [Burkholderiaceae bacterium]|nr:MAG: pilus assembly protein PilY [Burkholderiaceae bacterium]